MVPQLTSSEKRYLKDFLKSVNDSKVFSKLSYFYSIVVSIFGLILFTSAVIITLNNFNDRIVYWVLFPGIIGGIGMILFGIFLLKYLNKIEQQKKLATIIMKIFNEI